MSYSAKDLLQKAKEIEQIEKQKRAQELKKKREEEEEEKEQLQRDLEFFLAIGKKCVEAALDGHHFCIPEKDDLQKYKHQILQSGLTIDELKCNAVELREDFPALYEKMGIDEQLDLLKQEQDEILDTGSDFYDAELAKLNDSLYALFERAVEDEWHVHFLEKKLIDEINETSFIQAELYESDEALLVGMEELLAVLKNYQYQDLVDEDAEGNSSATVYLEDMISKIEEIEAAIKNNAVIVGIIKEKIKYQLAKIDNFLEQIYKISFINWKEDYSNKPLKKYNFLHPKSLCWLADNAYIQGLFSAIENKIISKGKFCEFNFEEYGPRSDYSELLYDGLYADDFFVEISINDLANVFRSLEYKVDLKHNTPKKDDVSNLLGRYILRISW